MVPFLLKAELGIGAKWKGRGANEERPVLVFTSDLPWMPQISTQKF